ncbi:ankyrin repeat-containing protein ITN1-like [Rosa sericea]
MASTTVDPTVVVLEVLNQFSNYERWSLAVKNYLLAEDLWDVVENTNQPPKEDEPEFKTWRRNNARALRIIQNCCGTDNSNFINKTSSAKDAWDTLAKMFEPVFFDFKGSAEHMSDTLKLVLANDIKLDEIEGNGSYDAAIDGDAKHLSHKQELGLDKDNELEETEDINHNDNNDDNKYKEFFHDVECGNWPTALEFLDRNPDAVRANIPNLGCTALHTAVKTKQVDTVKKLVQLMKEEDMEIKDDFGCMAFHYAVAMNNIQMTRCIVEKTDKVLGIPFAFPLASYGGWLPVLVAYGSELWEMASFLYKHTPLEVLKGRNGAELISQAVGRMEIDIAWDLIHQCPSLVVATDFFGHSPLNALAGKRSAFLSGKRLKFWEQWIYNTIHIPPTLTMESQKTSAVHGIRIDDQKLENTEDNQRNIKRTGGVSLRQLGKSLLKLLDSGMRYSFGQVATTLLKLLVSGHYNRLYEMKLIHRRSLAILRLMYEVTKHENLNTMQSRFVQSAIFRAVERGHIEFVKHILNEDPNLAYMKDAKGMNMFQFAIECRQEKIYSLVYGFDKEIRRALIGGSVDNLNNTVLHLVGRLPPYEPFDRIQDAALQMQRELQWLQEVEDLAPQSHGDVMNITDNMTARELFKKNHTDLMKEAEKSMKGIATSSTVVGALIVTMMFAATFTVPDGNNEETDSALLLHEMWFMVFIVSDAISLCLSTTSVIIFLGILTSRYAEVDFLKSLPAKMIFGLVTLFLSITTMMVAFSSAIYILLEKKSGTGFPVILLGGIPVTTFVLMQFRLLKEMVISTYGAGIFLKEVKSWRKNLDGM